MSDTVKLIIEIPKVPKNDHERWVLAHGTPLDDVKLKIEQDMSFDMFDDYGNETAIHKELWQILDNIGKGGDE